LTADTSFERDYPTSTLDGLPCRKSGAWAREKLAYLSKYMTLMNTAMKGKWGGRGYLDLLAGPGRCKDPEGEFDGSPIVALDQKTPFTAYRFVEGHPRLAQALAARVGSRAPVIVGDCNDPRVIEQLRMPFDGRVLGLAFIDNLGLDVPLDTIAALTRERPIDLCITFQTGDLQRNIAGALAGEHSPERWDAFFGLGWRGVARKAASQNLSGSEIASELLDYYGTQLGRLGYQHIGHIQTLMKNNQGVGLYRLILASRHPRGKEFFEKIAKIEPGGQRRLI
jgi:three-Cys-motif partner protein